MSSNFLTGPVNPIYIGVPWTQAIDLNAAVRSSGTHLRVNWRRSADPSAPVLLQQIIILNDAPAIISLTADNTSHVALPVFYARLGIGQPGQFRPLGITLAVPVYDNRYGPTS